MDEVTAYVVWTSEEDVALFSTIEKARACVEADRDSKWALDYDDQNGYEYHEYKNRQDHIDTYIWMIAIDDPTGARRQVFDEWKDL
jgi:hypothetical protein